MICIYVQYPLFITICIYIFYLSNSIAISVTLSLSSIDVCPPPPPPSLSPPFSLLLSLCHYSLLLLFSVSLCECFPSLIPFLLLSIILFCKYTLQYICVLLSVSQVPIVENDRIHVNKWVTLGKFSWGISYCSHRVILLSTWLIIIKDHGS